MTHDNRSSGCDSARAKADTQLVLTVLRETAPTMAEVPSQRSYQKQRLSEGDNSSAVLDNSSAVDSSSATGDPDNSSAVLRGGTLEAFDQDEAFARDVAALIGIDADAGESVWRTGDAELTVKLWRGDDDLFVFRLFDGWPEPPAPRAVKLAQAFALATTGTLDLPTGPELARWKLRLLVTLGRAEAAPVALPELPPDAPEAALLTWAVVGQLLTARRLTEPVGEPITFSAPWVARGFALDEALVRRGKRWLERGGYLTRAGTVPSRNPNARRPTQLWRVAEGDDAAQDAQAQAQPRGSQERRG